MVGGMKLIRPTPEMRQLAISTNPLMVHIRKKVPVRFLCYAMSGLPVPHTIVQDHSLLSQLFPVSDADLVSV